MRFLVHSGFFQVFPGGLGILLPQLLHLVDLLGRDLARPELLLLQRNLHQPRQEATVLDQRLPLVRVPADGGEGVGWMGGENRAKAKTVEKKALLLIFFFFPRLLIFLLILHLLNST